LHFGALIATIPLSFLNIASSGQASKQSGLGHWKQMLGTEYPCKGKLLILSRAFEGINIPSLTAAQAYVQRLQPVQRLGIASRCFSIKILRHANSSKNNRRNSIL
jgi:hypothetical protein